MKKLWILIATSIVILFTIKIGYDHYVATHLPGNTVVYYVPQHIYLHTRRDCPELYIGVEYRVAKDTYGRMRFSKMSNELCPTCVPTQYIH